MLGSLLKVVAVIIVGYIVGFFLGSILGAVFGIIASFFIPDVILPHQATLVSLIISISLGSLLSSFATQVFNRLSETNINSFLGAVPGALIGLVIVVFVYGYVEVSDPNNSYIFRSINYIAVTPVMPYSVKMGGLIGAITFAFFGAVGTIREIIQSHLQLQRNRELMKNSPPSKWGLPDVPREHHPSRSNLTTHSFLSLQNRNRSSKGRMIFFFLKAFVFACAVGIIVSLAGWQILGWNSSDQFGEGFFWTSALLAMYGYSNIMGGHRVRHNMATRYGETAGNMDLHERTNHWAAEAETSFAPFPAIFVTSGCLFVFAILISIIF